MTTMTRHIKHQYVKRLKKMIEVNPSALRTKLFCDHVLPNAFNLHRNFVAQELFDNSW